MPPAIVVSLERGIPALPLEVAFCRFTDGGVPGLPMPRKLGPKLILSLTVLIVAISGVSGYLNLRTQKKQLVDTMILGADQLSRSITGATWHAMLDDDRKAAYEIMRVIADKQGIDRIRMFNREGRLQFSTDSREQPGVTSLSNEVCATCHTQGQVRKLRAEDPRVRYATSPDGVKTINMVAPIYNEPSCSNASCHAHKASTKVLGVVDVALRLDPVQKQTRAMTLQTTVLTVLEVAIGAAFVILFTRRFVATPIQQLIEGTKRSAPWSWTGPSKLPVAARKSMNSSTRSTGCASACKLGCCGTERHAADVGEQGRRTYSPIAGGAAQTHPIRPPGLTGTTRGQRGARDQQSRLGRAQSLHAARAPDGERANTRPGAKPNFANISV